MMRGSHAWEWWGLIGIGLVTACLKFLYQPDLRSSIDGSFYLNVASHVANGDGLKTTVSLYRQGFQELPHASLVYPLWPLLLGAGARLLGLFRSARVIPELLFAVNLVAVFLFARTVARRVVPAGVPSIPWYRSPGAIALSATLLLASNHVFFRYSSKPYTEPLALALTLGALLALFRFSARGRTKWAVLAGVLAAAAYLTRSQCVGTVVGVLGALAIAGARDPNARRAFAAASAASLATVLPWLVYVARSARVIDPRLLLNFAVHRETPELPPFHIFVATDGWLGYVVDRASGVLVAFDPTTTMSYVFSWGPVAYSVVIVSAILVWKWRGLRELFGTSLTTSGVPMTAVVGTGVACLLPVHMLHSQYVYEWWFGHRYGLFLLLLIVPAFSYLVVAGARLRRVAALLLALSVVWGGSLIGAAVLYERPSPTPARLEFEAWLSNQEETVFLATHPQVLSVYTEAGFHWIDCKDPAFVTRAMVELLPIDFVVSLPRDRQCPFLSDLGQYRPVARFGSGETEIAVFALISGSTSGR